MIVKSGLVLEVPGTPKRYQLVHDYLVPFVRQWENAKLPEIREKFEEFKALKQSAKEILKNCDQTRGIRRVVSKTQKIEIRQNTRGIRRVVSNTKIEIHKILAIFIIINIILFSIRVVDIIIRGVA
jgi:hypothetical protein